MSAPAVCGQGFPKWGEPGTSCHRVAVKGERMLEITEQGSEVIKAYLRQKKWSNAVRIVIKAG